MPSSCMLQDTLASRVGVKLEEISGKACTTSAWSVEYLNVFVVLITLLTMLILVQKEKLQSAVHQLNMHSAVNKCNDRKGFRVTAYLKEFCLESTIGGIRHLAEENCHPVEILLWLIAIVLAISGTVALIHGSWQHYNDSPIVIAFDKEYRTWEIPIPAFTVCLPNKVDDMKALDYIRQRWPKADDNKTQYYLDFIKMAAHLSMKNMVDLQRFVNDSDLSQVDVEDLARKVHPDLDIKTVSPASMLYTYNEHGLCIGVDSVTERALLAGGNTSLMQEMKKVNYLNTTYNKIIINYTKAEFYVYSAYEVVDVSMRPTTVLAEGTINYIYLPYISKASEDLRYLSMEQRRCCFHDEMKASGLPLYSWNLCRMKCRVTIAQKLCGCVPHFYKILGTTAELCNLSGLLCISRFLQKLIKLRDENGKRVDCYCYPTCNEITIGLLDWRSAGLKKRTKNVNIGWVQQFPTTMYNRDILFTSTDLLVSFGSTAGLFLGVSLLSGVELVYFFTIRLLFIVTRRDNQLVARRRNRLEILQAFN